MRVLIVAVLTILAFEASGIRVGIAKRPEDENKKMALWSGCCLLGCNAKMLASGHSHATLEEHNCHNSKDQSWVELFDKLNGPNDNPIAKWDIQEWLKFVEDQKEGPKYVFQVGSYGAHLDEVYPLLKKSDEHQTQEWHGVIAEANPDNFEKLKVAYAEELSAGKLQAIHSAVTDVCEKPTLNFLTPNTAYWDKHPGFEWKVGTGYIDGHNSGQDWDTQNTHQWKNVEVPCGTTDAVMNRGQVPNSLDFVQVDAESHDARILMGIDFSKFSPKVIRWEDLPAMHNSGDVELLLDKLYSNGYFTVQQAGSDPFAVRSDVLLAAAGL